MGSPTTDGAGGTVKSSKVVSVSERDAVACIWWSDGCIEPRRESFAMAMIVRLLVYECCEKWQVLQGDEEASSSDQ